MISKKIICLLTWSYYAVFILIVCHKHMSLEKFMVVHFYSLERLEIEGFLLKFSLILTFYIQVLDSLYDFIKIGHI